MSKGFYVCLVLVLLFAFTTCAFNAHDRQLTERACIAAGREIWDEHCYYPSKPGEIRIR
jgi:hypothetical protein